MPNIMQEQQPYGSYTGSSQYDGPPQQYSQPPQGQSTPPPLYDDSFMDSLAQRLSQRMTQGPQGKVLPQSKVRVSAAQRLALAIVSVVMIVVLLSVATGIVGTSGSGFIGLAAFGAGAVVILLINVVFNVNG